MQERTLSWIWAVVIGLVMWAIWSMAAVMFP